MHLVLSHCLATPPARLSASSMLTCPDQKIRLISAPESTVTKVIIRVGDRRLTPYQVTQAVHVVRLKSVPDHPSPKLLAEMTIHASPVTGVHVTTHLH